jgi:VanZ family protein
VPNIDKLLHSLIYGLLAAATLFAVQGELFFKRPRQAGIFVILFCLLYGISDEWHQSFIPGRMPSIWDIAADTTGATLMVFCWFGLPLLRK